jgi:hypothetical protein
VPERKYMKVEVDIPDERIESALESGFRTGIRYWGRLEEEYEVPGLGRCFRILDLEREKSDAITEGCINRALVLMADVSPWQFGQLLEGNADAMTGNVLIQLALFGEVRYG